MRWIWFPKQLENSIENISSRYQTILYSFQLYTHLHRTLDSKIYKKEGAEKNCELRNTLGWILGENVETIFLHHTILTLYSLFEHTLNNNTKKIKSWDTESIYLLIQVLEENKDEINTQIYKHNIEIKWEYRDEYEPIDDNFLNKLRAELDSDEIFIKKNLRDFRHQIWHNFTDSKKTYVTVNTEDLEKLISRLWNMLNLIVSRIPWINQIHYETFWKEIADDYRKLFFFLNRQNEIANLYKNNSDESIIINGINKIYRPYILNK